MGLCTYAACVLCTVYTFSSWLISSNFDSVLFLDLTRFKIRFKIVFLPSARSIYYYFILFWLGFVSFYEPFSISIYCFSLISVVRRRNPLSIRHPNTVKYLFHFHVLVGLAVSCLGLWLCWWAPSTSARDNPYWSGIVVRLDQRIMN